MTDIDEVTGTGGIAEKSHGHPAQEPKTHYDVPIPHLPLTGTQKVICVIELILSGAFAVYLWSYLINHVMYLLG